MIHILTVRETNKKKPLYDLKCSLYHFIFILKPKNANGFMQQILMILNSIQNQMLSITDNNNNG